MNEELKACERCHSEAKLKHQSYNDGTTDWWIACQGDYCGYESGTFDTAEKAIKNWNSRELDDLRAAFATMQTALERLQKIIQRVEWSVVVFGDTLGDGYSECPVCQCAKSEGHDEGCPFYQWKGNVE